MSPTPTKAISLSDLLATAEARKASDLYLSAGSPPALRVAGELQLLDLPVMTHDDIRRCAYSRLQPRQIKDFERELELDFGINADSEINCRYRGNLYYNMGTIAAAYRAVPRKMPTLAAYGLPSCLEELALKRQGLILVTGPVGHGKSTTLAAMVDIINRKRRCHVVTIEDPVEFRHANQRSIVDQREVGQDTKSFGAAMRHVFRQGPDVILIGEMRDHETIATAITAAETGHLILSSLHTNDVVQSIDRLIDVFPPHQQDQVRGQISMSLLAIVGQRLLRRRDGKGLVPAVEILLPTSAVKNLIRKHDLPQIYNILDTGPKDGIIGLNHAILELRKKGLIDDHEARTWMRGELKKASL